MAFKEIKTTCNTLFLFVILSVLSLVGSWGCNGNTSKDDNPDSGTISFNIAYHGAADDRYSVATILDCAGEGIATIEISVFDENNAYLNSGGPWDCDVGHGEVSGVLAGDHRTAVVIGKSSGGEVVMRGDKPNISVVANQENGAGIIDCYGFVPTQPVPANGAVTNTEAVELGWRAVAGALQYRIIVSTNSNLNAPIIDTTAPTEQLTPSGLSDGQTYYWQVVAYDQYSNVGVGSSIWSFTIDVSHVNTPPVAHITKPDDGSIFTAGDVIVFEGSASDSEDITLSGAALVWRSNLDGQIGTGEAFNSSTLSTGTHLITLTATDTGGATDTDTVTIDVSQVNTPPVAHIIEPGDGSIFTAGDVIVFEGSASDSEDITLSGAALVWRSSLDGQIGTGEAFNSSTLSTGDHLITLTATDTGGATGTDTVTITVNENPAPTSTLPDTGQTTSYTDTFGEDSDYTSNPPAYTKLDASGNDLASDATYWVMVRDDVTGLIWEVKMQDGGIHDRNNTYTWQDAQDTFIAQLNSDNFGGYSDWRLPAIKELWILVHKDNILPAMNTTYFPNTTQAANGYHWSSTTNAGNTDNAFGVAIQYGRFITGDKASGSYYVRAVRGTQTDDSNLVDNGDGTVTDTVTGLMWQQDNGCLLDCTHTWEEALDYCESLELAGHDDWRMPNAHEVLTIIDYERYGPAVDTALFPQTENVQYWTSTSHPSVANSARLAHLQNGIVGYGPKDAAFHVRAVRGGQ